MKWLGITAIALASTLGWASISSAEETAKAPPKRKARAAIEVKVDVVAKKQRPLAAMDVAVTPLKKPLAELRAPLLERIEQAAGSAPF